MHCRICIGALSLFVSTPRVRSLPKGAFIIKHDDTNDSASQSFKLIPAPSSGRRNGAVESFFGQNADATGNEDDTTSNQLLEEIHSLTSDLEPFLQKARRDLHTHPELMYKEKETSHYVQKVLDELDVPYTSGWAINTRPEEIDGPGGYGVVADIGTGRPPCILLRADMDALPILERTEGVDSFKSVEDGKMHACGHDGHTTMLLGAAAALKGMEDSLNGTVRLMFQPAEEGGAGAKRMREEGVLELEPKPQHGFGMHLWPMIPSGTVASRPGPLLAAAQQFEIVVTGKGGHAAMPHLAVDPIVAASAIVMNLQTIVSRTTNPLESGVVSVTMISAGDAFNIIPSSATLRATVRALSTKNLLAIGDKVETIVTGTAAVHGCNVTIKRFEDYYPPTVNDPELFESFSKGVGALLSSDKVMRDIDPTMGGEDFSFVAETVPSTFFLLGQGSAQYPPTNYSLHHPQFAIDESVLPRGVELHVNLAVRALRMLARKTSGDISDSAVSSEL